MTFVLNAVKATGRAVGRAVNSAVHNPARSLATIGAYMTGAGPLATAAMFGGASFIDNPRAGFGGALMAGATAGLGAYAVPKFIGPNAYFGRGVSNYLALNVGRTGLGLILGGGLHALSKSGFRGGGAMHAPQVDQINQSYENEINRLHSDISSYRERAMKETTNQAMRYSSVMADIRAAANNEVINGVRYDHPTQVEEITLDRLHNAAHRNPHVVENRRLDLNRVLIRRHIEKERRAKSDRNRRILKN